MRRVTEAIASIAALYECGHSEIVSVLFVNEAAHPGRDGTGWFAAVDTGQRA
jgi:hypothetical protein